mmetsp:Transcript_41412/g.110487  ORF Transcript_41412/g.110487 Transcript_41412/m.110487 type:complete len:234 (+) Transcript_41412:96-797(+)
MALHTARGAIAVAEVRSMPLPGRGGAPSATKRSRQPGRLAAQLGQLLESSAEVDLEPRLVVSVRLKVGAEAGVPGQDHIGDEHHLVRLVIHLAWLLVDKLAVAGGWPQLSGAEVVEPGGGVVHQRPLVLEHVGRVLVRKLGHVLNPWARVAGEVGVAAAIDVAAAQEGHDLLVIEAHSAEHFVTHVGAQPLPTLDRAAAGVEATSDVGPVQVRAAVLLGRGEAAVGHAARVGA